jgi:exodeoxyribonuclease-5
MALDVVAAGDAASDAAARVQALTAMDRTMLVEAGAGTGKTSVLAGRVVMLLAAGRHPESIAAISFTEFSAAELRERIALFVDAVIVGPVPPDLRPAFPSGQPSPEQVENIRRGREELDLLSCMTIHGFCRILLTPYPVEANIDPGAVVLDRAESDLLFEETLKDWLRDRLNGPMQADDVFLALFLADAAETRRLVEACAKHLRSSRGSTPTPCEPMADECDRLRLAVEAFRAFLSAQCQDCCPEKVAAIVAGLEEQVAAAPQGAAGDAIVLPWILSLRVPRACATAKDEFNAVTRATPQTIWKEAAGARVSKAIYQRLQTEAARLYTATKEAHTALRTAAAGRALHLLAAEAEKIVARYDDAKRKTAAIDFDDLLEKTRVLLGANPAVRAALSARYPTVLVDEFQDSDPQQVEILWRLCGDPPGGVDTAPWTSWTIRPGALFLVGDPKQSIFRFRGGDLPTYQWATTFLNAADPGATVRINRNFRSRDSILNWVNERFRPVFTGALGQAAATDLITDAEDRLDTLAVAYLQIRDEDRIGDRRMRDIEADLVAQVCKKLIGNFQVRDRRGGLRPCEASDIALLTPTSTDLWRYERALEEAELSVAAQAGKGFFRREEVQDLIALTRVLADSRDRLALGALLRGPLVGIPDSVLLDAVEAQLVQPGREPHLHLGMDLDRIADTVMREVMQRLVALRNGRRTSTPHILLGKAIEELCVRPILRQRGGRVAERALANVDLFMEMARPYDLRGLKAFSDAMRSQWEEATRSGDARPDADRQSVNLITIHSGKGLEWAVVILVNLSGWIVSRTVIASDRLNGRFHMEVFGRNPIGCDQAMEEEKRHEKFQRERLCYVAGTRARDLLLLPDPTQKADARQWLNVVDLKLDEVPVFPWDHYGDAPPFGRADVTNAQDRTTFIVEADRIGANTPRIKRVTPSREEGVADASEPAAEFDAAPTGPVEAVAGGGWVRGNVLHKLLEEVLSGELRDDTGTLEARGGELLSELGASVDGAPDLNEMAAAVRRGLTHPEIAAIRHKLRPEWQLALSSMREDGVEEVVMGAADAVAIEEDGTVSCVVDWKSDVQPTGATVTKYRGQLGRYLQMTRTTRGLLVFLSSGEVHPVCS